MFAIFLCYVNSRMMTTHTTCRGLLQPCEPRREKTVLFFDLLCKKASEHQSYMYIPSIINTGNSQLSYQGIHISNGLVSGRLACTSSNPRTLQNTKAVQTWKLKKITQDPLFLCQSISQVFIVLGIHNFAEQQQQLLELYMALSKHFDGYCACIMPAISKGYSCVYTCV